MATGYSITIGYNANGISDDKAWEILKENAEKIAKDCEGLGVLAFFIALNTIRANGIDEEEFQECLNDVAKTYTLKPEEGGPLSFIEDQKCVFQMMSGDTTHKRWVRRAFVALIMDDMHRLDIEINLSVA